MARFHSEHIQRSIPKKVVLTGILALGTILFIGYKTPDHWASRLAPAIRQRETSAPAMNFAIAPLSPLEAAPAGQKSIAATSDTKASFKVSFENTHNYLDFADKAIDAASKGDVDAQYYLARALMYCMQNYARYFNVNGRWLSIDEGLQLAARKRLSFQLAQQVYDRCNDMHEHEADRPDLGNPTIWLDTAARAGHPLAQGTEGARLLREENERRDSPSSPDKSTPPRSETDATPRELLRDAVASLKPEALMAMADAPPTPDQSYEDWITNIAAWHLVACERGYDCSAQAEWVWTMCQQVAGCAPGYTSGAELINTLTSGSELRVASRVQEINTLLTKGFWSALVPDKALEPREAQLYPFPD